MQRTHVLFTRHNRLPSVTQILRVSELHVRVFETTETAIASKT